MKKENYYKHIRKLYMTPELSIIETSEDIMDGSNQMIGASAPDEPIVWESKKDNTVPQPGDFEYWEDEDEGESTTYYNWGRFFPNLSNK